MKRRRIIFLATVALAGILALAFWPGPKEPEYGGHKLRWWLGIGPQSASQMSWPEFAEAAHHIGPKAIPFLLNGIPYEESASKRKLLAAYRKLPAMFQRAWVADKLYQPTRDEMTRRFYSWFMTLGADGEPAVPKLIKIAKNPKVRAESRLLAIYWLRWIGGPAQDALPVLQKLESDPDPQMRSAARIAMRAIKGTVPTQYAVQVEGGW